MRQSETVAIVYTADHSTQLELVMKACMFTLLASNLNTLL